MNLFQMMFEHNRNFMKYGFKDTCNDFKSGTKSIYIADFEC